MQLLDRMLTAATLVRSAGVLAAIVALAGCRKGTRSERPGTAGRPISSVAFHGIEDVTLSDIAAGPSGAIVGGRAKSGLVIGARQVWDGSGGFLAGIDVEGRPLWVRLLPAEPHANVDAVATLPDGGAVFAGFFAGAIDLAEHELTSAGGLDCFVGRVDSTGLLVWIRSFGSEQDDMCRAVAVADPSRLVVVGSFSGTWTPGDSRITSAGMTDVLVLDLALRDGSPHRAFGLGTAGEDIGRGVDVHDGLLAIVGSYGGPFDRAGQLAVEPHQRVLQIGAKVRLDPLPEAHDHDGFLVVLDRTGSARWGLRLATKGFDVVKAVSRHGDGYVVTGAAQPSAPRPGTPGLASNGPLVGYVHRITNAGAIEWTWSDANLVSGHDVVVMSESVIAVGHYRDGFRLGRTWDADGQTGAVAVQIAADGTARPLWSCDGVGHDLGYAVAGSGAAIYLGGISEGPSSCAPEIESGPAAYLHRIEIH